MDFDRFSRHHKLTVGLFAIIGIAAFAFGLIRLERSIALPFLRQEGYAFKTLDEIDKEKTEKLKTSDTDQDGLNDYDELYVFRTSPFLSDTDSDGDADGAEVNAGQDPNCPKGKACGQTAFVADAGAQTVQAGSPPGPASAATGIPSNNDAVLAAITASFGEAKDLTPEKISARLSAMTLAELQAFLQTIGIPDALLEKADEKTLRDLIQETLTQSQPPAAPQP